MIPGNLFVVIISPYTNHFTAGVIITGIIQSLYYSPASRRVRSIIQVSVIIEFQAEITVYCDTCTRETIH